MSQPTALQSAAATLVDVLTNAQARGERRVWLGQDGTAALQELADLSNPASQIEKLTAALEDELGTSILNSAGPIDASLAMVGDGPSQDDMDLRSPFSGPVGDKLNGILGAMGLNRDKVFLTHLARARQKNWKQTIATCLPLTKAELSIIAPKLVIVFGERALHALTGDDSLSLDSVRGKPIEYRGLTLLPTAHPSVILEADSLSPEEATKIKRAFWEDMLAAMEHLSLPISEKQRNFFKR
ncbi:uracil-DNA glycosylase [Sulfuriroseicoccus oceanibius]|uniref:Uracil-DNA glycosylase n=1 Tax=Sulfuriroseicoccus oceanibius TaxID=2707525 RepID=A0A6B3L6C6_9BACT|nr:uracil-DNA glycosylase [Sulfuriroseicoccus oceanibius]QQL46267.1 uracil-DNA glycosylase [Sulfuriroseicoccus oceanibius]